MSHHLISILSGGEFNKWDLLHSIIIYSAMSPFHPSPFHFQGWSPVSTWHWFLSIDSPTISPAPFCGQSDPLSFLQPLFCTMSSVNTRAVDIFRASLVMRESVIQKDPLSPNMSHFCFFFQNINIFGWDFQIYCYNVLVSSGIEVVFLMLGREYSFCLWSAEGSLSETQSPIASAGKIFQKFDLFFYQNECDSARGCEINY